VSEGFGVRSQVAADCAHPSEERHVQTKYDFELHQETKQSARSPRLFLLFILQIHFYVVYGVNCGQIDGRKDSLVRATNSFYKSKFKYFMMPIEVRPTTGA
jgi:hypothetical protein